MSDAAKLEADLRAEVRKTARRIAVLVFLIGLMVFFAARAILTPGLGQGLQVVLNIGAAVYAWHVAVYLDGARREWLAMIAQLERMKREFRA